MAGRQPSALVRIVRRMAVSESTETADGQLLRRFVRDGDAQAFAALVDRHGPMVLGVCRRMVGDIHEAEDCFQATFLVLARRAGAVGRPERVGGWLHGVACRVASRARHVLARRRARESQAVDLPRGDSCDELIWRDLRPVLDEEVGRLPERYRLPFVLCYLDGRTNEEAAGLLGCPKGTVLSRLATARERLRRRLTRRGITLSVALLGTMIAEHATATVPVALVQSTLSSVAGSISADVAVLVKGVFLTMRIHRLAKAIGFLLLTAVVVVGGTLLRGPLLAQADAEQGPEPSAKPSAQPPAQPPDAGQRDKPPVAKADAAPETVEPRSLIEAYQVNDARADEVFNGKRVRVMGMMAKVKRVRTGDDNQPDVYRLTMMSLRVGSNSGPMVPSGPGPGMPGHGRPGPSGMGPLGPMGATPAGAQEMLLTFDFPLSAGKDLATLRYGQKVTIEGRCEGPHDDESGEVIRFRAAKLIQIQRDDYKLHDDMKKREDQKKK
jgi:RNA polymerase sigma factor (sigma-70 family)